VALRSVPLASDLFALPTSGPPLETLGVLAILVAGAVGAILVETAILDAALSGGDPTTQAERRNCPSCGAPTDAASEVCAYCKEPLPGDAGPDPLE